MFGTHNPFETHSGSSLYRTEHEFNLFILILVISFEISLYRSELETPPVGVYTSPGSVCSSFFIYVFFISIIVAAAAAVAVVVVVAAAAESSASSSFALSLALH